MARPSAGVVQVKGLGIAVALGAAMFAPRTVPAQVTPVRPATPATPAAPARTNNARAAIRTMTLTSPAFADGGIIPHANTQAGRDTSPALAWSGAPDSTQSFVLLVHDIDAPLGDGTDDMLHWLVWSIPGNATSLPAGVPQGAQAANGMRQISGTGPYYRGPASPSTGPMHHYVFELYALDTNINVAPVGASVPVTRASVIAAMTSHIRAKGTLVGLYRRPAP